MNDLIHFKNLNRIAAIVVLAAFCLILTNTHAVDNQPFNLSITTHLGDEQTFREGDMVSFYVCLEKDAYLAIVYQDASDQLNLLLPNPLLPNSFFKAGWFVPIPNAQNPFQFRITEPFGKETLWIFASDKPFPSLPSTGATIVAVRDTIKKHCRKHNAAFEEASLSITTTAVTHTP